MESIAENPFRALGLVANSSEREIQKQIASLSAYARVGKSAESIFDFPLLPTLERTEESIRAAANRIEQPTDRLHHALLWFLKGNHMDEAAFDYLRADKAAKAAEIWMLAILEKPVAPSNFRSAANPSARSFFIVGVGGFSSRLLELAIRLTTERLEQDVLTNSP